MYYITQPQPPPHSDELISLDFQYTGHSVHTRCMQPLTPSLVKYIYNTHEGVEILPALMEGIFTVDIHRQCELKNTEKSHVGVGYGGCGCSEKSRRPRPHNRISR